MTIVTNEDFLIFVVRAHTFTCDSASYVTVTASVREFLGSVISARYACLKLWRLSYVTGLQRCGTSNGPVFANVFEDGCPVSAVWLAELPSLLGASEFWFQPEHLAQTVCSPWQSTTHISPRRSNEVGDDTDRVNSRWFVSQSTHPSIRTSRAINEQQIISVYKLFLYFINSFMCICLGVNNVAYITFTKRLH